MREDTESSATAETAASVARDASSSRAVQRATEHDASRAWRETNAEHVREYKRAWRERNADHIAAYRRAYRAEHLEEVRARGRERERARHARQRAERERREQGRVRAREWYAKNRDRHLEAQRQYRTAQRAKDPDAYRESKRERNKRWRDGHKDEQNAKLREKHRANPEVKRTIAERYYANNAERVKAKRRERYAANRDKELARQRVWREREKRRIDAGLPPRRLHRVTPDERAVNQAAADEFFARVYAPEQIAGIREQLATDTRLIARLNRDNLRARAKAHQKGDAGMRDRFQRSESRQTEFEQERARLRAAMEAEDARLDAIARTINDRLRTQPRRRRRLDEYDPSASHAGLGLSQGGIGL